MTWKLAYVEHCLPGDSLTERLATARAHGLAAELANRDPLDVERVLAANVEVVTLQAWGMHATHPLHPDPRQREAGARHLAETIELAARLGVPRVVAACGFGSEACASPSESCRAFFDELAPRAREHGVRVLIEPLSPLRAPALTTPDDIAELLDELAAPDVFGTLLDTGHLLDGGHDPEAVLGAWPHRVDEVQLRGAGSRPPRLDAPFARWLGALATPPDVVAFEHREPIDERDLERLVANVRLLQR